MAACAPKTYQRSPSSSKTDARLSSVSTRADICRPVEERTEAKMRLEVGLPFGCVRGVAHLMKHLPQRRRRLKGGERVVRNGLTPVTALELGQLVPWTRKEGLHIRS